MKHFKSKQKAIEYMLAHVKKYGLSLVMLYNFRVLDCSAGIFVHLTSHNCASNLQNGLSYYFKNQVKK